MVSDENLTLAIDEVNRTHRWHPHHKPNRVVKWVEETREERRAELRQMILGGFTPSPSTPKRRWDKSAGKWRDIYEPRLWPDQYIHHAVSYTHLSEGSGLNDSVYGKCQAPIRMFLEKRGEAFEQESVVERLFLMGTSENYGDLLTSMTAMAGFEPVGENGAYPEDSMQEGYQKLLVYETWKDSFSISKMCIRDSRYVLPEEKQHRPPPGGKTA